MAVIYKICDQALWDAAKAAGVFTGATVDLMDGFIHFSTASQVRETAAKHFSNRTDLLIFAVESDACGDAMKWEPSRGGALFPHLYNELSMDKVLWVKPLPLGKDGTHSFPELD